jgi:gamma-glutamyltranspeptidase/glutathione hydrolase
LDIRRYVIDSRQPESVMRWSQRRRRAAALLLAALLAAGCRPATGPDTTANLHTDFGGAVVADEPRAVTVARDVLAKGGSTADAAVALYFTLAVTLPSEAGLGGGGICLIHDVTQRHTEVLDFLPRPAAHGGISVPANARGMAALHARYGRIRWQELLGEPESLARFGAPTSRALAREMATAGDRLAQDPAVRAIFSRPDGKLRDEGEPMQQVELASVIGAIRQQGAGALYSGMLAKTLSDGATLMGATLTTEDLRVTLPQFRDAIRVVVGDRVVQFVPTPGGIVAAEMTAELTGVVSYGGAGADERPHLFVEASMRAFADRAGWLAADGGMSRTPAELTSPEHARQLMTGYDPQRATPASALNPPAVERPENPWATSFLVADAQGNAVACNLTMNDLFGTARMVPGTGIILAPAPDARGIGAISLTPVMMTSDGNGATYFVGAASGGPTAATSIVGLLLDTMIEGQTLDQAMPAKRLHHGGAPDVVLHEEGIDPAILASLTKRGHQVAPAGIIGRTAAMACSPPTDKGVQACGAKIDGRTDGLAQLLYK